MGLIQNSEQIEYWTHLKTKNTGLKVQGRQGSEIIWFELNWTILHQIIPPNWTFVFYQLHSERASEHYETHIPRMPTLDATLAITDAHGSSLAHSWESESEAPFLHQCVHLLLTECRWTNWIYQWCVWNWETHYDVVCAGIGSFGQKVDDGYNFTTILLLWWR